MAEGSSTTLEALSPSPALPDKNQNQASAQAKSLKVLSVSTTMLTDPLSQAGRAVAFHRWGNREVQWPVKSHQTSSGRAGI